MSFWFHLYIVNYNGYRGSDKFLDGRIFTWELKGPKRNNVYAKFWGDKKSALWYVIVFSGVVNDVLSVLKLSPVSSHKTIIWIEGLCRLDAIKQA